ncbi:glycyl-tRNA synthetase beta chain [Brevundimonas bullata]|uniref:Glycine--tRNA ligase beta subunit n=1 Tax=Brevundimonas bullata TaxID=13160 RepID=A0A7W7IQD7_9CAUL|nr:glycine--tRNA ligase subunit beta [Brevundimonas bullata]MBB4798595.1 glycyl-tRNA synthetase beta chain [Brevundimonas bullata]MBB6383090.1 glycyl-tRNA synthetase beta chain [Brevundimonas bullata]
MPQLLLEIFSEEIPARMQQGAARDLERMVSDRLKAAGLTWEALNVFAGPRRLTLVIDGLPVAAEDRNEEVKGPKTSAPAQALEGFLRKTGLTQDQLVERDGIWFAEISSKGRQTTEVFAEAVDQIVRSFPWPKSMRWGAGTLRWVRPIKRIIALFDGAVVPFEIDGIQSGDVTEGHRFMGSGQPFAVKDFADYRAKLERDFVLIDVADRKLRILEAAKAACAARGLVLVDDDGLLDEVAGLAEWPTPILGDMDPQFLSLPPEVVRLSMKVHQKYFAVRDPSKDGLAPNFLVVANVEATDGGQALAAGNSRVLSARLNDARFFWDEDQKVGFDAWNDKLKGVTFHAKLGTLAERVDRIAALAREIAPLVGADADQAEQAARLSKADLASGMVSEFPELQGIMGGYYARLAGYPDAVADAVRDHYKPQGPGDSVPTAPVTVAVAIAEKLDTLVGFFAIDEKPTGSRDPYALRRAALGVIRLVLESGARIGLRGDAFSAAMAALDRGNVQRAVDKLAVETELSAFFADRLTVLLRDQGQRHDLVAAVFALGDDDLVRIVRRVEALAAFLATDDGANLLAGYKRASNILKAEEKKGPLPEGAVATGLANQPAEETALAFAAAAAATAVDAALETEDFAAAMTALAALRGPVDAFFTGVMVNSDVAEERENRLKLLGQVRGVMGRVADFGQIAG